jgi:competence protein ComGC
LSEDAVTALKPEQVTNMPAQAMVGLTAKQIGSLPAVVLQKMPAEHFKNLDKNEVKNLDSKGLSKVLVNINTKEVKTQEVKNMLPSGWTVDNKGRITAPAGSTLSLPAKTVTQTNSTVNVEEPSEVANLDSNLTVGGAATDGETTVLDGLNSCLKTAGFPNFKMKQDNKTGKIVVEGSGDAQGAQLTFTTKSDSVKQADSSATTGLTQDESGHYVLTTEDKKQVTVIPAAKDTTQLAQSLGDASSVKVAENGVTTVEIRKDKQSPAQVQAMVFDPMITKASSGKKPGIYTEGATGEIVYSDGTSQKILPTVPQPDQFVTTATKFPGVEKAQFNADGTVAVQYKGMKLKLCAKQFTTQTTPLAEGQTVQPNISVQTDGTVKYTTQEGTNQVEATLTITE